MPRALTLRVLPAKLAVCRLGADSPIPQWAWEGNFLSVTRTAEELSIIIPEQQVPDFVTCQKNFRAMQVAGPLDFSLVGVLASIVVPLKDAGISIFAVSTYDTDYVLVREADLERAITALRAAGHAFEGETA